MTACPLCQSPLRGDESICPFCGHTLHAGQFQLEPNSLLRDGRYQLLRVLGQGGFGISYQGQDTMLHRQVAIKELFPEGSTRQGKRLQPPYTLAGQGFADVKARFLEEARSLAQFNHPGIVRVLDIFEENNSAYLVMEYLQGESLAAHITKRGRLPPEEVLVLAQRLGEALETIHRAELLHRDIKPDNIMLSEGRIVLIDFGSARNFSSSDSNTQRYTRLLTPGYAPPEQYASQARFGAYTDIYALAATLYHAVSGQPPLPATDRLLEDTLTPLASNIPSHLRQAIMQGLELRIHDRPADAQQWQTLLAAAYPAVAATPSPSYPTSPADILPQRKGRHLPKPPSMRPTPVRPPPIPQQRPVKTSKVGCLFYVAFAIIFGILPRPLDMFLLLLVLLWYFFFRKR